MMQITLTIDSNLQTEVEAAAQMAGVSLSEWIMNLIRDKTSHDDWPATVRELAGAWPDMPTAEDIRKGFWDNLPRELL